VDVGHPMPDIHHSRFRQCEGPVRTMELDLGEDPGMQRTPLFQFVK
jgi:hypothetical protein